METINFLFSHSLRFLFIFMGKSTFNVFLFCFILISVNAIIPFTKHFILLKTTSCFFYLRDTKKGKKIAFQFNVPLNHLENLNWLKFFKLNVWKLHFLYRQGILGSFFLSLFLCDIWYFLLKLHVSISFSH